MAKDDIVSWGDIPAALGLLTRLPVRVNTAAAMERGARAAWAWPVAGLTVGLIAAVAGTLIQWLGLPPAVCAGVILATQVILTGAMHEDGLADSADGLWGGYDKTRRLEIMKDSHIGTYGVLALILSMLLRWTALSGLIGLGLLWPAVIVAAVLSRVPMVGLMHALPPARSGGLSATVGCPPWQAVVLAATLAVAVALLWVGPWALPLVMTVGISALVWAAIANVKIGGQTGDILGASQQWAEITALLTILALAS